MTDQEWIRLETALGDTNVRIIQQMREDFESGSDAFNSITSTPQEALNRVNTFVRDSLGGDGGNPTLTNT